jgi:hypothetical protein
VRFPSSGLLAIFLGFGIQTFGQSVPPGAPVPRSGTASPVTTMPKTQSVPSAVAKTHADPVEVQREAKQILELSRSIQPDIEYLNRGLLPKTMIEKLKRIEKLSKHLRGEIDR